jgi:hypothetical protein
LAWSKRNITQEFLELEGGGALSLLEETIIEVGEEVVGKVFFPKVEAS